MATVIGLSAYFHDSSCCVLRDGRILAAAQEERFSRVKHDASLPVKAFRYCLAAAGLSIDSVDCVAYYENPERKLERQVWSCVPDITAAEATRLWWRAKQPCVEIRELLGWDGRLEIVSHHAAHAASAFFYSGFSDAAVMTVDAVGEWASTTYGQASEAQIDLFEEVSFPDSLGLFYSAITSYLGFSVNDGEYKVMGLAPYGSPTFVTQVRQLVASQSGGQYRLNPAYFDFTHTSRMFTDALIDLFGHAPRPRHARLEAFHADVARSVQQVLEEVLLEKVAWLRRQVASDRLCMAGGVALNCVANRRIVREGPFERLFVQPAAGDAGAALGAAALAHVRLTGERPPLERLAHVYLGPRFPSDNLRRLLRAMSIDGIDFEGREGELLGEVVTRLVSGQVVAWFQGRMEFGPRALGARSILGDPRDAGMRDRVNRLVKRRESFRPFAPAVLERAAAEHFDIAHASPYMLETCQVISRLRLPAVTHVDGSARVQTVDRETHPRFAALLECFADRTGCPILLNTSFNLNDEPIVCSPLDALRCFARSNIDALVLEDFVIDKDALTADVEALLRQVSVKPQPQRPPDTIYPLS